MNGRPGAAVTTAGRTLVLVGCGKMGSALLRGWIASGAASRFRVVEPAGVPPGFATAAGVSWHRSPEERARRAGSRCRRLRGQAADHRCGAARLSPLGRPQTLFVSIVAGKTIAGITRHLGPAALVRTMPNTPAAIGRGITVACANARVTPEQRRLCDQLLAAVGESAWVEDEALLDAVTAVSGSGPAYVFLLIEALAQAAEAAGLPPDLALRLARAPSPGRANWPACPTRARRSCART